jgi:hypothetical protein
VFFLNFVLFLEIRNAFGSSFEFLSSVASRPAGRSAHALAVGEASDTNKIMTLLLKLTPFERKM